MKNYYDMLSVAQDAAADDIKKAFRREIARYHPDKVQHLGKEFQEMAAAIAADLTEAYRILMDPALRTKYDEQLTGPRAQTPASPGSSPAAEPVAPPSTSNTSSSWSDAVASTPMPPRSTAGIEFVKRAAMSKMREAIDEILSNPTPLTVPGFDIALVTKPKKGLFKKAEESVCLLVKFVPQVDSDSVSAHWPAAARVRVPEVAGCVLMLVGPGMAPAKDLSNAVTELRRKSRNLGPVLVPIDVRDWEALFPPDTPTAVRNIVQRLKDDKR